MRKESCSRSDYPLTPRNVKRGEKRDINMNYEGPNINYSCNPFARKEKSHRPKSEDSSSPNTSSSTIHAQNVRGVLTVPERVPWYIVCLTGIRTRQNIGSDRRQVEQLDGGGLRRSSARFVCS